MFWGGFGGPLNFASKVNTYLPLPRPGPEEVSKLLFLCAQKIRLSKASYSTGE